VTTANDATSPARSGCSPNRDHGKRRYFSGSQRLLAES
jgi:hypothetical protein